MNWFRHRRRWLITAATIVVLYAVLGFLVAPPIARTQIRQHLSAALDRPVTVAKVRVNPFTVSVTVEGLRIGDRDGGDLASWTRAYVNFDPLGSLWRRQWHCRTVHLVDPRQRLVVAADGTLNLAELLAPAPVTGATAPPPPAEEEPAALPAFGIGHLRVEGWAVDFADASRRSPFRTTIGPMTFELRDFSTKPDRAGPYSFAGASDTIERFAWSGTISAAPAGSKGRVEVRNIALPPLMPFAEEVVGAEVRAGRVSIVFEYEAAAGDHPVLRLANTLLTVDGLALGSRGAAESAVAWQQLEVHVTAADLLARTAEVSRATLTGLDAHVQRLADGAIDLLQWLPPAPAPTSPPETAPDPSGPAPSVRVAEMAWRDARVRLTDHSTPRRGTIVLDQINVTATNLGTDRDREIALDAAARWDGSGTLGIKGTVRLLPLAASLDIDATAIALSPLAPWIEPFANIRLASGTDTLRGHLDLAQPPGGRLALAWSGENEIANLAVHDGATNSELLAWQTLRFNDTRFVLEPREISIREIALIAPRGSIAIDEHGALNLAALRRSDPAGAGAEPSLPPTPLPAPGTSTTISGTVAAATRRALPFNARIDAITITDGAFAFRDRSIPGGYRTELRDFGGAITGLSSAQLARAEVDLRGMLDGVAPLRIAGSINPLADDRFSDVTVTFSNIALPPFTPFSGRFLGQTIREGTLQIDLRYRLSQNVLEAENRIVFDRFHLGDRVESPDAIKLPLGLALALLRDRNGRISIDLPIRGSLDDPDFKYGRLVWQAIGNLVVKAATSPFAMLGGMFGGGEDEDLSHVEFASGATEFSPRASDKLGVLARALFERPALRLQIIAPPAADGDRAGLRAARFHAMVQAEIAAADPAMPPPAMDELIARLFARQFPDEIPSPAAVAPAASSNAPGPPEETASGDGLLSRVWRTLTGGQRAPRESAPPPEADSAEWAGAATASSPLAVADMRARLLDAIALTDADFQALASDRARAIRERLLADGRIEPERITIAAEPFMPDGAAPAATGARVFFGLE